MELKCNIDIRVDLFFFSPIQVLQKQIFLEQICPQLIWLSDKLNPTTIDAKA